MSRTVSPKPPPSPPGMEGRSRVVSEPSHPGTYFIGRYRVVDDIGVGGMATVHLARMDGAGGFQKWVAIKRIHPHLVENEQIIKMFLDEARIAASISHPNVAQVFDLGSFENTYWIAMEYLHGEPLREVLRHVMETGDVLSGPLAARIIADAAEGLHAAHELRGKDGRPLNLVHRDVTPHNLFITYAGVVKVVDFGIAKVAGRLSSTQAGTLKGKIAYMAPEQIRGKDIDRRADIFALGVVLWELTTGRRLFRMDTDLETVERVQDCVVPPPSSLTYDYPVQLESIVMTALRKNREDRFQTARDLSRALQQYLLQSSQFIGPEEVSAYIGELFGDRIQQREAQLKWAADVTKTLSFENFRPAFRAAGLSVDAARQQVGAVPPPPIPGQTDDDDDDDDDADETVVEPFRAAIMRQEAIRYNKDKPATHDVPRPKTAQRPVVPKPSPGGQTDSITIKGKSPSLAQQRAFDTKSVDSTAQNRPSPSRLRASEPSLASNDLVDDDEDDEVATIVREPAVALKQDRLFAQGRPAPSAANRPAPQQPQQPQQPHHPVAPSVTPSGVVPVPSPSGFTPSGVIVARQDGIPAPARMPSELNVPASGAILGAPVPGPAPSVASQSMGPVPPISQQRIPTGYEFSPAISPTSNPYVIAEPGFDENQWARGLRGSPILVYAAAALGGFLVVAVLIAVLLGGPEPSPQPIPLPPPSPASS
ncbi:MAG: Tyrosine-protein kinase MasK [Deltaproteobacteria bacterium ADurb.Bin207]|nr:MAG: Tyrosine-protein kinase MasK [Deltaproteobacteria bacterium ADurb.Bin207]